MVIPSIIIVTNTNVNAIFVQQNAHFSHVKPSRVHACTSSQDFNDLVHFIHAVAKSCCLNFHVAVSKQCLGETSTASERKTN